MTAVIQRVNYCKLTADGEPFSEINKGLLILLGVRDTDTVDDVNVLANKIDGLRLFTDENDKMNLSVNDIDGDIMVVSNFTLCADVRKGKRPSFTPAADPDVANAYYEMFIEKLSERTPVKTGVFGADMQLDFVNDGPVTLVVDSKELLKK